MGESELDKAIRQALEIVEQLLTKNEADLKANKITQLRDERYAVFQKDIGDEIVIPGEPIVVKEIKLNIHLPNADRKSNFVEQMGVETTMTHDGVSINLDKNFSNYVRNLRTANPHNLSDETINNLETLNSKFKEAKKLGGHLTPKEELIDKLEAISAGLEISSQKKTGNKQEHYSSKKTTLDKFIQELKGKDGNELQQLLDDKLTKGGDVYEALNAKGGKGWVSNTMAAAIHKKSPTLKDALTAAKNYKADTTPKTEVKHGSSFG